MRQRIQKGEDMREEVSILDATDPTSLPETNPQDRSQGAVVADATAKNKEREGLPEPPPRYRVARSPGIVLMNGWRGKLPVGKELDARSYDLKALKNQGVVLEEVLPE